MNEFPKNKLEKKKSYAHKNTYRIMYIFFLKNRQNLSVMLKSRVVKGTVVNQ